ncbi:MAG: hypothetical protein C0446_08500 [Chitinophaga sp.]|nr:hypothetical protein [Chitinophaga sp.]
MLDKLFKDIEVYFDQEDWLITLAQFEPTVVNKAATLDREAAFIKQTMSQLKVMLDVLGQKRALSMLTKEDKKMFYEARYQYSRLYKNLKLIELLRSRGMHVIAGKYSA